MALSCSAKVLKYVLFVLNLLLWLCGVVLLGLGIWILSDQRTASRYLHIANLGYGIVQGAAITLVLVGIAVFIIGVLGCCGAFKENARCLSAFSVILIILLVLQVLAVILAGSFHSQIIHSLSDRMNQTMVNDFEQYDHEPMTEAWNFVQMELKCCGIQAGIPDWQHTKWFQYNRTYAEAIVPQSCCAQLVEKHNWTNPTAVNATACYQAAKDTTPVESPKYVHVQGCEDKMNDWFMTSLGGLIGGTVVVIITQIIIVIMSCLLKTSITNSYEHV